MRRIVSPQYTTIATAVGGRAGRVRTKDGTLDLELTRPKAFGGPGEPGTNPEQLFACAYSACFESAVRFLAEQAGASLEGCSVTAEVTLGKAEDKGFALAVKLSVALPEVDRAAARALVDRAHQTCPFSHATRGNIEVRLEIE